MVLRVARMDALGNEAARSRLLGDTFTAASLNHRNIASVLHCGEVDDLLLYTREFVDGLSLEDQVRQEGPLSLDRVLHIAAQAAEALEAIRLLNLVHRQISPQNLITTPEGVLKLVDLGLDKADVAAFRCPDGTDDCLQSLSFASPEQIRARPLDIPSDIYSLGVTLWFLLTGQCPFRGTVAEIVGGHLYAPLPVAELPLLPSEVVDLLKCMLEKDPALRLYPAELAARITACQATVCR